MANYSFERATISMFVDESPLIDELLLKNPVSIVTYTPYNRTIFIEKDGDFVSQGFIGSGTPNSPYLLENRSFTNATGTLIYIKNTRSYFKIQNCSLNALNSSNIAINIENVNNGEISNNTIYNCSENGIQLNTYCKNNLLSNNIVNNCSKNGIYLFQYNDNNIISNNTIYNCSQNGIDIFVGTNNTFSGNTIYNCSLSGIDLSSSIYNCTVSNNTVFNCYDSGIYLKYSINNTISNNTIYNCNHYGIYLESTTNNTISKNSIFNCDWVGLLLLFNCKYNIISDNKIYDFDGEAISLGFSSNYNTITRNTVYNLTWGGISVSHSEFNTISDNTIFNCSKPGIEIEWNANNNNLSNNIVFNCSEYCIEIDHAHNNTISGNTVYNCSQNGIGIIYGNNSIILGNEVSNCSQNGIFLHSSNNNSFNYNFVYNNTYYGFFLNVSSNNIANWNNLFNNNKSGIIQAYDNGSNNNISYNYWNDLPGGGVYDIDGGLNTDSHALSAPAPPKLIIISPFSQDYDSYKISVTLYGYVISHYWYYIEVEDINNQTWTSSVWRVLPQGSYTLHAYANNSFGITTHVSVVFTIVPLPPTITIESPINTIYTTSVIVVDFSGNVDHYWYYIAGVDDINQTWITSHQRSLVDNTYTLHVYGNDTMGNEAYNNVTFTINTPPTMIIINSPSNTTYTIGTIIIDLSGNADQYWYFITGDVTNQSWFLVNSRNLTNGSYTLWAYGNDSVGNEASANVTFTIETYYIPHILTEPVILSPNYGVFIEEITIRWTPAIDYEGHQVTYDLYYSNNNYDWKLIETGVSGTSYVWNITNLLNGSSYSIKLIAKCSGGLEVEVFSSFFTIDNSILESTASSTKSNRTSSWTFFHFIIIGILLIVIRKRIKIR